MLRVDGRVQAFPVFILAMALVAGFGPSAINVIIALTILQFADLPAADARAQALARARAHLRRGGARDRRRRHAAS